MLQYKCYYISKSEDIDPTENVKSFQTSTVEPKLNQVLISKFHENKILLLVIKESVVVGKSIVDIR